MSISEKRLMRVLEMNFPEHRKTIIIQKLALRIAKERQLAILKEEKQKESRPTVWALGKNPNDVHFMSTLAQVIETKTSSIHSINVVNQHKPKRRTKERIILIEKETKKYKAQFKNKKGDKVVYWKKKKVEKVLNRKILSVPPRDIWDLKLEQKDNRVPDLEKPLEVIYTTNEVKLNRKLLKDAGMKLKNRLFEKEYEMKTAVVRKPLDLRTNHPKQQSLLELFEEYKKETTERQSNLNDLVKHFQERRNK